MEQKPEIELIAEGREGNQAALSELFGRHYASCLRLARGILRSEEEALDVVQSALLSAYRHLDSFRGESSFKTWIARIVVNQCFMHLREPGRRVNWVNVDALYETGAAQKLTSPAPSPEKLAWCGEIGKALTEGASRLPPPLRDVFLLYAGSGLSLKEVAATMNLTLSAVKTRLFRANVRMRSHLRPVWLEMQVQKAATGPYEVPRVVSHNSRPAVRRSAVPPAGRSMMRRVA